MYTSWVRNWVPPGSLYNEYNHENKKHLLSKYRRDGIRFQQEWGELHRIASTSLVPCEISVEKEKYKMLLVTTWKPTRYFLSPWMKLI